jgi:uncharacterized membrane protein
VKLKLYGALALAALACCAALGVAVLMGAGLELLHRWLLLPSLVYFVSGTLWAREKEAGSASAN